MKRCGSFWGWVLSGLFLVLSFVWITAQFCSAQEVSPSAEPAVTAPEDGTSGDGTVITGPIDINTTWTISGSPYIIVGDDWHRLLVNPGACLTVEPGVIVKVSTGGSLVIHGQLDARGTVTQPVIFTSLQDDSAGGDSNGDGSATAPAPGDWYYIVGVEGGHTILEHAEVRYAGRRDAYDQGYGALFTNSPESSLWVTSTLITASNSSGIYLASGFAAVISNTVQGANGDGIHEHQARALLRGNHLLRNQSHGILLEAWPGEPPPTVTLNLIADNLGNGIHISVSGVRFEAPVYSNTIANNARFPVYMQYMLGPGGGGLVEMSRNTFTGNGWGDPGFGNALTLEGDLIYSQTLAPADGPVVIIWNLHVKPPARLTVQPGMILKFVGTEASLAVTGRLEARGTPADPIYFTSIFDDEAGGDTNGDGSAILPDAGQWRFVQILGSGQAVLEHVILHYGGYPIPWNPPYGIVYLASPDASLVMSDTVVSDSGTNGLYLDQGQVRIVRAMVQRCDENGLAESHVGGSVMHSAFLQNRLAGVTFSAEPTGPSLAVTDNLIASNEGDGVAVAMLNGLVTPTLTGNTIQDNGAAAIRLSYDPGNGGSGLPDITGTTFSGNGVNGVRLTGGLGLDLTLPAQPGVVYQPADLNVPAGVELRLDPGVIAKVTGNLGVQGRLVAIGQAGNPVVFTSLADDRWGGDTNSDGTASQPAPGDWGFIQVSGSGSAVLDHALLHYGGYYYPWNPPRGQVWLNSAHAEVELRDCEVLYSDTSGLYLAQGHATVQRCELAHNRFLGATALEGATVSIRESYLTHNGVGIAVGQSHVTVASSNIYSNTQSGAENDPSGPVLHAEDNWWGHPSGPYDPVANPSGLGDAVGANVAYVPWLAAPGARHPTQITLGEPTAAQAVAPRFTDFQLGVRRGMALVARVTPQNDDSSLWVFGRQGDLPNWTQYDQQARQKSLNGSYELPMVVTRDGTLYLSVYGYRIPAGSDNFQIEVEPVEHKLVDLSPRRAGNGGQATLWLTGLPFAGEMDVELRQASTVLTPLTVTVVSSSSLWTTFNLQGAPTGVYDVAAIWPDHGEAILSNAFTLSEGIGPQVQARVGLPDKVRPGRTYVMQLEYTNVGDTDMAAPLLSISNTQGVPMRLAGQTEFTTGTLQIMGTSPLGDAGTLPLAGSGQVPVYFQVPAGLPAHTWLNFRCLWITPRPSHPIDWSQWESQIRPPDVNPELWNAFWPAFISRLGNTLEMYQYRLDANARYLAALGRPAHDTRALFQFEARKLLGVTPHPLLAGSVDAHADGPGMALEFSRVFPGSTEARFYLGPLGYGWSHAYDIFIRVLSTGDLLLHWPGAFTRQFYRTEDGTYQAAPGDTGRLAWSGDHFVLTEKDGTVTTFRSDHRWDAIQDPNGNRIWAVYNGAGQLVELHHSGGAAFTITYNAHGRIASLTDQAGRVTTYGYDAGGQHLLSVTAPGGRVTSYTYYPSTSHLGDHALTTITAPDGRHVYYAYDNLGRLKEEKLDGDAERIRYFYGFDGEFRIVDQNSKTHTVYPDENGRPTLLRNPLGHRFTQQYDTNNQLTVWKDAAGRPYQYQYDVWGNMLSASNPLGGITSMGYDPRFHRLTYLQDPNRNQTGFQYDEQGNLVAIVYPDGSHENLVYNEDGNPTHFIRRSGDEIVYTYDAAGRLVRKDYPDGSWAAYTYDAGGNLASASDPDGTVTLEYDPQTDRLIKITYPSGHFFTFAYDAAGRRTQRLGDDGYTLNYEYDPAGRLARLTDGGGTVLVEYLYDAVGRLSRENHGNGTYTTYSYDAAGQLTSLVNHAPDGTIQSRFDYTYDANGNRTSMTTLQGSTTYGYDAANQLTSVAYPDGRRATYAYDAAGNRQWVTENGAIERYTTNPLNQYTQAGNATFGYDLNGNLISRTDASGTTTYQYDYENRLVRVNAPGGETWEYSYNALGQRTAVRHNGIVTEYLYDPIGWEEVAAEYGADGALQARYVQGLGLVARLDPAGTAAYYAFDATGNTRQLTGPSGSVVNRYDYDPFGLPLQVSESVPNPFKYVGQLGILDDGHRLLFMRNRYYSPELGRFISPDPIGYVIGSNLYQYVLNNPMRWMDPVGFYEVTTYDQIARDLLVDIGLTKVFGKYPGFEQIKGTWDAIWDSGTFLNEYYRARNWPERFHALGMYGLKGLLTYLQMIAPPWLKPFILPGTFVGLWDRWTYDFGIWLFTPRTVKAPTRVAPSTPIGSGGTETITPSDPNEKDGPVGVGEQHLIGADQELTYVIYFENVPSASAPAQEVVVTDYLDPHLDWTTLRLTEIAWGDEHLIPPDGHPDYVARQAVEDYRPEITKTWWVDVHTSLNLTSGRLQWALRTLDPETGQLPEDPLAGFLPPNDAHGRGEGWLVFTIRPRADLPAGTVITNQATIVFDVNAPIATNSVYNTVGQMAWRYLPLVIKHFAPSYR